MNNTPQPGINQTQPQGQPINKPPVTQVQQNQIPIQKTNQTQPQQQPVQQVQKNPTKEQKTKKSHGKTLFILLLLIIIGIMGYYIYTDWQKDLKTKCSPLVPMNNQTRELDINSTLVQDLYNKVKTNIREDIASTELDDQMKLYLAYRQLPQNKIYESNCNLFNNNSMTSVTCKKDGGFIPNAFKEEDLQVELKKLFGEDVNIENNNIELANSCIGAYQYIKERGEYVQGSCSNESSTIYNADKKLISATVTNDIITLKEKVRYYGSESVNIDRLRNGIYIYKFKLDNNYNYAYISKSIEEK